MENEEIEAPYRIIGLSEIGPLVLGKWSQIYVGSKCIGRLGDLSFKPSKYDYIPDTQLKIQMVEPFLLSIQKPIYAIQSVKFVRIYSTETISYTCINDADDTSRITGSNYVTYSTTRIALSLMLGRGPSATNPSNPNGGTTSSPKHGYASRSHTPRDESLLPY